MDEKIAWGSGCGSVSSHAIPPPLLPFARKNIGKEKKEKEKEEEEEEKEEEKEEEDEKEEEEVKGGGGKEKENCRTELLLPFVLASLSCCLPDLIPFSTARIETGPCYSVVERVFFMYYRMFQKKADHTPF